MILTFALALWHHARIMWLYGTGRDPLRTLAATVSTALLMCSRAVVSQCKAGHAELVGMVAASVRLLGQHDAATEPRLGKLENNLAFLAEWKNQLDPRGEVLEAGHLDHASRIGDLEQAVREIQATRHASPRRTPSPPRDSSSPPGDAQDEPAWLREANELLYGRSEVDQAAADEVKADAQAEAGPARPYNLTLAGDLNAETLTMLRKLVEGGLVKVDQGVFNTTDFILTHDASLPVVTFALKAGIHVITEKWIEMAHLAMQQSQQLPDPLHDCFRVKPLHGAYVMIGSGGSELERKQLQVRVQQLGGSVCRFLNKLVTHLLVASPSDACAQARK